MIKLFFNIINLQWFIIHKNIFENFSNHSSDRQIDMQILDPLLLLFSQMFPTPTPYHAYSNLLIF